MMKDIKVLIVFSVLFLILLGVSELLFRYFKVRTEYTRKFAHFSTGLATLAIPYYFTSHWAVLVLTLLFFGLLILNKPIKLLRSIDSVHRVTIGSYLFPLSIYSCFLVSSYFDDIGLFVIPILILAISDTLAAIFGTYISSKQIDCFIVKDKKTIAGSTAFFISTMIILLIAIPKFFIVGIVELIIYTIVISTASTIMEMVSRNGFDNLFVPLLVSILLLVLTSAYFSPITSFL